MDTGIRQFDAMRLERDAARAGEAFGFEDVEATEASHSGAALWMMRVGLAAVVGCCLLYTLA